MKVYTKRVLAFALSVVMMLAMVPTELCVGAAPTPKMSSKKISISIGETKKLKVKNVDAMAKIVFTSANKKVATVSSKGVVKGISAGNTKVVASVINGKKTVKVSATIKVYNKTIVKSQKQLDQALKKQIHEIVLKSSKKETFTIKKGVYSKTNLTVDAKNADVVNNGNFKSIKVKAIASDTWTENASGNILVINANAGRIIIPETTKLDAIVIKGENSNFALEIAGTVGKVSVESTTNLNVKVSGTIESVEVMRRAEISFDGKTNTIVPIVVNGDANGTKITSNVAVAIDTKSSTEINLEKGA
ncbi:MAG: hypothetical protein E7277_05945, partial [Lachnospiraceae bacterium]|nr:hypothetical protein [Lachnospiraceae bacterium]